MQEMSTAMATLLKSGKQIGANRPTAEVSIEGSNSSAFVFVDKMGGTPQRKTIGYNDGTNNYSIGGKSSNFVPTEDGRFITCWIDGSGYLECGYSPDEDFFHTSYNLDYSTLIEYIDIKNPSGDATNEIIVPVNPNGGTDSSFSTSLFKRSDGKILLFINDPLKHESDLTDGYCTCLISNSGNGDDFEYYSTVFLLDNPGTLIDGNHDSTISKCMEINTPSGKRLIIWFGGQNINDNYFWIDARCCVSDNNGATWVSKYSIGTGGGSTLIHAIGQLAQIPSGDIYIELSWTSTRQYLMKSTDYGETWAIVNGDTYWGDNFGETNIAESLTASLYYHADNDTIYRYSGWVDSDGFHAIINPTPEKIENKTNWKVVSDVDNPWNSNFDSLAAPFIEEQPSGNIALYTRDHSILQVFGWDILSSPIQAKSITINRSKGMAGGLTLEFDNKAAILAPDGTANPQLLWPNKDVVVKQGYGAELLKTFTGLIDSISMSRDEQGVASVTVSARDKLKVALDHLIRNAEFLYTLTYTNMLVEDIWKNLVGLAGLTYNTVEATGLTISSKTFSWETYADAFSWLDEIAGFETYCDEEGLLNFVWDGRPSTVTTAYSFIEGADITRLGYEINDADLYYTVAVYGKAADESVIYYAAQLPQATYWNIPSGKVLRIDAPDADTQAKCEIIADKAIYLMQTKARQVTFETIGIPHLQRGDFIQVTESSTTISEIYRITDITTQQGPDGYSMTLTCYYHAAPEVV